MPSNAPRTEEALDDWDDHESADRQFARVVGIAIQDNRIDPGERLSIEQAFLQVVQTGKPVRRHIEAMHAVVMFCRSLMYCGELTPKLLRRQRELSLGSEQLARHSGRGG